MEINPLYLVPAMLVIYWLTRRNLSLNNLVLLICGYLLYAWGSPAWGLFLFLLSLLDFWLVKQFILPGKSKRAALVIGLLLNIGIWLLFKYSAKWESWLVLTGGVPLGVSFYMLRKIAYLVDCYMGHYRGAQKFLDYALYVSFYPQILSGPIERPDRFIAQIEKSRQWDWSMFFKAFPLLLMGLFKKIVVADNLGMIVYRIFRLDYPSRIMLAAGSLGYTFEIYADFSGYTDLSRGFSYLLGFETTENFNQPYIALTPQDFWNRWHISFSTWLRDYIFFPLRRKLLKIAGESRWLVDWLAPIATMLVSGFWHGTGWTFIVWGLYYGILLAVYQAAGLNQLVKKNSLTRVIAWMVMFTLIVIGWMIFRAPSLDWLVQTIAHSEWGASGNQRIALFSVLTMIVLYILPALVKLLIDRSGKASWLLEPIYFAFALAILIIFAASGLQDFVYSTF